MGAELLLWRWRDGTLLKVFNGAEMINDFIFHGSHHLLAVCTNGLMKEFLLPPADSTLPSQQTMAPAFPFGTNVDEDDNTMVATYRIAPPGSRPAQLHRLSIASGYDLLEDQDADTKDDHDHDNSGNVFVHMIDGQMERVRFGWPSSLRHQLSEYAAATPAAEMLARSREAMGFELIDALLAETLSTNFSTVVTDRRVLCVSRDGVRFRQLPGLLDNGVRRMDNLLPPAPSHPPLVSLPPFAATPASPPAPNADAESTPPQPSSPPPSIAHSSATSLTDDDNTAIEDSGTATTGAGTPTANQLP
ncbi:hypothetical protein THASP1DRAFT_27530 [Thamnocephalis sphaerospora]|uniref:Uncharacterized protein n=1 Tax=Thamnocephalis sphaerospora TaxID=78915 RepID=A0A4P9XYB1_9FUNG|nr:hypothetical protein THASP1DRAFT_27530 [Thamnocephalis sphaerospora]|eukprot:RKP10691.1 hypothetical protein THASP1DRAFT_27530 [Thamnocephalis sphaerospora]